MRERVLDILACPKCRGELSCTASARAADDEVISGTLACRACRAEFPIAGRIPRFVGQGSYASSFGYQWNRFRLEQIDSFNGTSLSAGRFFAETDWTPEWMSGKWLLDVGCGAGRFLDVVSRTGAEVVGVDLSNAVDAARTNLADRQNVHLVQASIYELPFSDGVFEGCYCIGVIQHTPEPLRATRSLPRILRESGRIALTAYERKPRTRFAMKYLIRPLTKKLNQRVLLFCLRVLMPLLFSISEVLFRIPYLSRLFEFMIPVANYVHEPQLNLRQRYRWAILDTFDALSPKFDRPLTQPELESALNSKGITPRRLDNPGLNLIGVKSS